MTEPSGAGVGVGLRALSRGAGLLFRNPSLWPWAILPIALSVTAFALALWAVVANLEALAAPLESALAVSEPVEWYAWIWVGPLLLLAVLAKWLLLAAVALLVYFTFTAVGGVIAAPFLDVLSSKVEALLGAPTDAVIHSGVGSITRSVFEELKRTAFFLAVQLAILLFGLFPGVQPVAAAASLLFAALFLPLDHTAYTLDRRGVPFRVRRAWILRHAGAMLAFGGCGLALFVLPGLSFFALPWLVASGTVLALEVGLPAER